MKLGGGQIHAYDAVASGSVESRNQNEDIPAKNLYNKKSKIYYSEE